MKKTLLYTISILTSVSFLFACNKDKDDKLPNPKEVKSITVNWEVEIETKPLTTEYIYDENYQLIELKENYGNILSLSYERDTIIETFNTPKESISSHKIEHQLNAEGYVISSDLIGSNENKYSITYNNEYIYKTDDKYTFTWSDDNLSEIKYSDLHYTTFTYNSKLINLTNFDLNVLLYQTTTAKSAYDKKSNPALIKKAGKISQYLLEGEENSYTSGNYSRLEKFRFVYKFLTLGYPSKVYVYSSYGVTYDYPKTPDLKAEELVATISFDYY